MEPVNVAIVYYSASGNVHALAQALAEGAEKAGAAVRLRKVAETLSLEAITANPYGTSHVAGAGLPGEVTLQAARHQARRAVEVAAALKAGRSALHVRG